eukprot:TRINITY_DN744_c0_g1_i5.p1 TRINITY_DN744_c0_g1~~TRINITY_DN744_c0_g1_i5.p1  ORF type:complete len:613 (+),score=320.44 TRINITY_DN744_c0_g1_i5:700-2538(+)
MSSITENGQLFNRTTQAIIYNFKIEPVQRMLDFDYLCKREIPSVAALVTPGSGNGNQKVFFGATEIFIPIFGSTEEAAAAFPNASVFISYASFRSAYISAFQALQIPSIKVLAIIAEGVPEADTRRLISESKKKNKVVIGPATVGGIQAGAFKIGDTAGTVDNIIACKLYRPGSVGFVSKSGGLSNESYNILAKATNGLFEGIAIGGDVFPGSNFLDHLLRFEKIPEIKMMVVLGEIGGTEEYGIVNALKEKLITKPIISWVSGTCAKLFPTEVQFGHAGAKSGKDTESAHAKNAALKEAGAIVPDSFEGYMKAISETYQKLVSEGIIVPNTEPETPQLPTNFSILHSQGGVRRPTGIVSTICDDRGEEPTYATVPISNLITDEDSCIGDTVSLLWFKRRLPKYAARFIEIVLMLTADHGPCVSGAHNTIVAARAGKDLVSCVASGLLTIGPRFGGAIDEAARNFRKAVISEQSADDFVEEKKRAGVLISGIGHRIKQHYDKRVELMKTYAEAHFPVTRHLKFALAVEAITLQKAANLVLNVDGCIASLFLDLMESCASFSKDEIDEIVEIGYLNGLFVLARTIGLIGHALDQKRLKQPLYRHPWDDVMYWS